MITYPKHYRIAPECKDTDWIISQADAAKKAPFPHITDAVCPKSAGGPHDYYSNGDYWWPNPDTADGLPYIQRDGESNPDNFSAHRKLLRSMRTSVVYLAWAWHVTKDESYAAHAVEMLRQFFLDEATKMNPHLAYAQALPGICDGRGIGIIDTLHLADVPFAIELLHASPAMTDDIYKGLRSWFAQYLGWMLTHENGIAEMTTTNNHAVCFFVQAAVFALFTDNERIAQFCRDNFKRALMRQMAADGSFPRELGRTKPYNYSIFVVDNMISLCHLLSTPEDNLWDYVTEDGKNIQTAIDFITPYMLDKTTWPYRKDVMHFDAFPVRNSFLQFAGCTLGRQELIDFYNSLPEQSQDEEARRNLAVRLPFSWM